MYSSVIFNKFGEIKLGADHAKPEYKNISWFAMLFAAGMGIGLVFFGVSEPLMHFLSPPSTNGESISAQSLAIFALSAIMFLKLKFEVSELITGTSWIYFDFGSVFKLFGEQ